MRKKSTIAIIGKDDCLNQCIASKLKALIPTREPLVADDVASFGILSASYPYFDFVFIDSIGFDISANRVWLSSMVQRSPQIQIIILEDEPDQFMDFIRAGGSGCLDRTRCIEDLPLLMKHAILKETWLPPKFARILISECKLRLKFSKSSLSSAAAAY